MSDVNTDTGVILEALKNKADSGLNNFSAFHVLWGNLCATK